MNHCRLSQYITAESAVELKGTIYSCCSACARLISICLYVGEGMQQQVCALLTVAGGGQEGDGGIMWRASIGYACTINMPAILKGCTGGDCERRACCVGGLVVPSSLSSHKSLTECSRPRQKPQKPHTKDFDFSSSSNASRASTQRKKRMVTQ